MSYEKVLTENLHKIDMLCDADVTAEVLRDKALDATVEVSTEIINPVVKWLTADNCSAAAMAAIYFSLHTTMETWVHLAREAFGEEYVKDTLRAATKISAFIETDIKWIRF